MDKKLTDICKIQYGYAFDSAKFSDSDGVPLIRIRDVVRGYSETYTTEKASDEYIVYDGDMLIGMDGEFNIAHWKGGKAYLNQRVCRLIPSDEVDSLYLYYFMPKALKAIEDKTPFVTVKHLSAKELNKVVVPMPLLDEQKRIASSLQKVDELISLRKGQLAKLDRLVKSRFIELFGEITEVVPVSYYVKSLTAGKSLAGEEECANKVLKTGAATYDEFDATQVKNLPVDYMPVPEHLLKDGDIIISRMNTAELVGATAYVWRAPQNTYLPDRLWRAELQPDANAIFVWQMLIQPSTKEQIRREASGTSGSMKNISKPGLLGLQVKKVPREMQKQFATFVEHTDKSKLVIQQSLDKLELLKKSLMQEYFG